MKRSGVITFFAKFPKSTEPDAPQEVEQITAVLRQQPGLGELEFYETPDGVGGHWYWAEVPGFFYVRDLRRIAEQLAAANTWTWVQLWLTDDQDVESPVLIVNGGKVEEDR